MIHLLRVADSEVPRGEQSYRRGVHQMADLIWRLAKREPTRERMIRVLELAESFAADWRDSQEPHPSFMDDMQHAILKAMSEGEDD